MRPPDACVRKCTHLMTGQSGSGSLVGPWVGAGVAGVVCCGVGEGVGVGVRRRWVVPPPGDCVGVGVGDAVVVVVVVVAGGEYGGRSGFPQRQRVTGTSGPGDVLGVADGVGVGDGLSCGVSEGEGDSGGTRTPSPSNCPAIWWPMSTVVPAFRIEGRAYACPSWRPWFVTAVSMFSTLGFSVAT